MFRWVYDLMNNSELSWVNVLNDGEKRRASAIEWMHDGSYLKWTPFFF